MAKRRPNAFARQLPMGGTVQRPERNMQDPGENENQDDNERFTSGTPGGVHNQRGATKPGQRQSPVPPWMKGGR